MIERWSKQNGYRDVLAISLPLVASMGSITLMQFTDRIFLANYSVDAISAALPFTVVLLVCCISLWKGLLDDHNALKRLGAAELR